MSKEEENVQEEKVEETPKTETKVETKVVEQKTEPLDTSKYDAELAAKDVEIKRLSDAWLAEKNSTTMTKADVQRAQEALATAVRQRTEIEQQKDQLIKETQEKLETVSQATQTLSTENTELTTKFETAEAKATKLEILTEEFPELLRYAKLIPANRDAEVVRTACKALAEARQQDLEAQRIGAVTNNQVTSLGSNASRVEAQITDTDKMREYLNGANKNPQEYEKRRQILLDQYEAARARQ